MKLRIWIDSGANFQSMKEQVVDLDDLGLCLEEWADMTHEEQEEVVKEVAFETLEWGWEELL